VPTEIPASVSRVRVKAWAVALAEEAGSGLRLATPKSNTLRVPSGATTRLSGLISRWTTPLWWAWYRALQAWVARLMSLWDSIRVPISLVRFWPSTYSMAMKGVPSTSPAS